jgi:predicted DNA-binding protein with PD1-like motif
MKLMGMRSMNSKLLDDNNGSRTFAVILKTGDAVMETLTAFASRESLHAAQITGIGALQDVVLKYFDWETKNYRSIPLNEQVEVASLVGDIAVDADGKPTLHVHIVVGRRDGTAMAGHLGEAHVRPTLEIIVRESPSYLQKLKDPETGLALIHPEAMRRPGH